MKLSKEMKVWVKHQETRKESCVSYIYGQEKIIDVIKLQIENLKKRKRLISKGILLEKEQIKFIQKETDIAFDGWKNI